MVVIEDSNQTNAVTDNDRNAIKPEEELIEYLVTVPDEVETACFFQIFLFNNYVLFLERIYMAKVLCICWARLFNVNCILGSRKY